METTPAALPVPPLTEEQKAAPRTTLLTPERVEEVRRALPEIDAVLLAGLGPGLAAPLRSVVADMLEALLMSDMRADCAESEAAECTADNARLSHLLEEERRTVAELKQRASDWVPTSYGLPSTRHDGISDMVLVCIKGEPVVGPHILVKGHGKGNYFWMENGRPGSVEGITHWLQYPGKPKPAPTCQRDCQKCAKAEAVGEIIGRYETSGLPVYDHHDYVTDVEGCYLTRAEADELAQEAAGGAGVGLQGEPPLIELRADRVGFDSPEYATRIEKVNADVESLNSKNPYHIASAKQAREIAHHVGYSTKSKDGGLQGEEGGGRG